MAHAPGPGTMSLTGAVGGVFSGLTGVGGGALMVPLMTGVLKMRQHTAHGTSLVIIVFAAIAGSLTYMANEGVLWGLVAALLAGSLIGAYTGARVVQHVPGMRLRQAFGVFLLIVAVRLLLVRDLDPMFDVSGASEWLAGAGIGLAGGLAAGALGVGGGAIFVPGLVILLGTGQHAAQGVSLEVIVLTAIVGAATHHRHGDVDFRAARWMVPAAIPAGVAGGLIASALDANVLQRIFAVVILAVGAQMVISGTRAIRRGRVEPLRASEAGIE